MSLKFEEISEASEESERELLWKKSFGLKGSISVSFFEPVKMA